MKKIAIIQARTGSTRLPDKVFLDLAGKPLIWHVFDRLSHIEGLDGTILATTKNQKDDRLEDWARDHNIACYRGSEEDVLARYYFAAKEAAADIVIRITADDPFKDPRIIESVIDCLEKNKLDFAFNNNPPSFPEGLDTEVFTFEALEKAQLNSTSQFEREHVTQYFYRNPALFKVQNVAHQKDLSFLRWTIDTKEDYEMVKKVYDALYKPEKPFLFNDILRFLEEHPEIPAMNSEVKRSAMYSNK